MISVSAGSSADYLTGAVGGGREGYYSGAVVAGEPPGRWVGAGAAKLGLSGPVDAEVMGALYGQFRDPRAPEFADPETRDQAPMLGRAPKQFRSTDEVVAGLAEAHTAEHGAPPSPEQMQAWRIQAERDAPSNVMFLDMTFSPQKSVTVLHTAFERAAFEAEQAGRTGEAEQWRALVAEVDAAVQTANDTMLAYVDDHAGYARTGRHGTGATGRWEDAHGFTVSSFYQHTSRDHDPQLHVHNAILNRVQTADGKWRAVDSKAVHRSIQGAGAIASAVLTQELTNRLGIGWVMREDGNDREVAGVDRDVMDLFSSRSKTLTQRGEELIAEAEERLGQPLNSLQRSTLMKQASLGTRRAKTSEGESREEMIARWDAEARAEVAGGLKRVADRYLASSTAEPGARPVEQWSADAVIAQAVEAAHGPDGRSTFSRHDLLRQIYLALPAHLGLDNPADARPLLESLTDRALEVGAMVQVSGIEIGMAPADSRLANGRVSTMAPGSERYAGQGHVAAETALLSRTGARGRTQVPAAELGRWLDEHAPEVSPAQREVILGLGSSDAALATLIGPAGTGKSYTVGTLAGAWQDLAGGRVVGVATAQIAADVLRDDGVVDSANVTAFLAAQDRIAAGRALPSDARWTLGARDCLVVDEASMVDTRSLTRLQAVVDAAGARMVWMGDQRQLGAVGAGGMLGAAVEREAETYTLTEVRRFDADWERDASLRLRAGDESAVEDYDRHGRIHDSGLEADAIAQVARAAAADRISGADTIVVTASNEHAAAVASAIRQHLVSAGLVSEEGVILGRDGSTAGVGDVVQARRIDRTLGLTNRETYRVQGVNEDGSLTVTARDGRALTMPASYVSADAALAYASTAHGAQGATVDRAHVLLTPGMGAAGAYVGMTRGRESNIAWAITHDGNPETPKGTGRGVLASILSDTRSEDELAAVDVQARDEERRASASTLLGLVEAEAQVGSRQRLDDDLDLMVAEGRISEQDRARFVADQGTGHLAKLLRAHEQAGQDPRELLRGACGDLRGAVSAAQVLSYRISSRNPLPVPDVEAFSTPGRLPQDRAAYLGQVTERLGDRERALGSQLGEEPTEWVLTCLGPVPEDPVARLEWETRAGRVAAYREAAGWDSDLATLGRAPGVSMPERRALWHRAYAAAGMPEERRPEAEMSDGQLLVRAAAAERLRNAAPTPVYDAQRAHHLQADTARRDAVLACAEGRLDDAEALEAKAAGHADAATRLDGVAEARGRWLTEHAETFGVGESAAAELRERGIAAGHEDDRITGEEWLELERAARAADDAHRPITEADIADDRVSEAAGESDPAPEVPRAEEGGVVADERPEPAQRQDLPEVLNDEPRVRDKVIAVEETLPTSDSSGPALPVEEAPASVEVAPPVAAVDEPASPPEPLPESATAAEVEAAAVHAAAAVDDLDDFKSQVGQEPSVEQEQWHREQVQRDEAAAYSYAESDDDAMAPY